MNPKPPQPPSIPKPTPQSFAVSPARREAYAILLEIEKHHLRADDLLRSPRVSALSAPDRHLTTTLVMGTLRWQIALDAQIRPLLSKPNAKLDPEIGIALRLGAFQILHLDRIPAHAAIGESVALAKLAGHKFASGMVNAVLRKLAAQPKSAPQPPQTSQELANATAHPQWLVDRWIANYGFPQAQAICNNGQQQPELSIRIVNPETEAQLAAQGVELALGAILTAARRVLSGDPAASEAFKTGQLQIQEEGSQLIAELASDPARPATFILDACAAPGGKTLILAECNPQAKIVAQEISPTRLEALRARIAQTPYASQVELIQGDATQPPANAEYDLAFDLVLADVPCSGTGTLGRNPEIRHRLQPADLARHHQRQCDILSSALQSSKHRVIYSTCSLEPEENAKVISKVLAESLDWRQIPVTILLDPLIQQGRLTPQTAISFKSALAPDGSLTILPGSLDPSPNGEAIQTDGFFIAILEKTR